MKFGTMAAALFLGAFATAAHAADCSQVRNGLRSLNGSAPAILTFVNRSQITIRLEWADYNGNLQEYATVEPGRSHRQETFLTHPWVATSMPGDCLGVFLPRPGDTRVVMQFAAPDDGEESDGGPGAPAGEPVNVEGVSFGGVVRAGPGMQFAKVASLREGEPVMILEDSGVRMGEYLWFRIAWRGKSGYMWGGLLCAHSEMTGVLEICR
jgi:hypothetical protein